MTTPSILLAASKRPGVVPPDRGWVRGRSPWPASGRSWRSPRPRRRSGVHPDARLRLDVEGPQGAGVGQVAIGGILGIEPYLYGVSSGGDRSWRNGKVSPGRPGSAIDQVQTGDCFGDGVLATCSRCSSRGRRTRATMNSTVPAPTYLISLARLTAAEVIWSRRSSGDSRRRRLSTTFWCRRWIRHCARTGAPRCRACPSNTCTSTCRACSR